MKSSIKYQDYNIINQVCQIERFKQHQTKVQRMASTLSHRQFFRESQKTQQLRSNQFLSRMTQQSQKQKNLFEENRKVLQRITHAKTITRQSSAVSVQSARSSLHSLNMDQRRKDAIRIIDENQKLMKRLQRTPSTFKNKDTMLRDYKKTQELKQRISKTDKRERLVKVATSLSKGFNSKTQNKSSLDYFQMLRVEPKKIQFPKI